MKEKKNYLIGDELFNYHGMVLNEGLMISPLTHFLEKTYQIGRINCFQIRSSNHNFTKVSKFTQVYSL